MALKVGLDIGGTQIKSGLIDDSGRIIKRAAVDTEADKGKNIILKNIFSALDSVFEKDMIRIGVGIAGQVEDKKIITCPNIKKLNGLDLKRILEKRYKVKVNVDNDANCFSLGENLFGAGRNSRNMIGVTLGTGVGGGIIVNKSIYHGAGNAGEIGHIIINFDGILKGEAEDYLSARWFKMVCGKTPKEVYELAEKGDRKAKEIFKNYGKILGVFLTNIIHAFDPDCIVIGGNISNSWKYFNKAMSSEIKKRALFNNANIVKRELGDDAALLGAASLVIKD
jgi:glucokinase